MAEGRRKLMVRQRVLEHPDRASSHLCRLPFIHRKVTRARSRAKWRRGLVGIEFETASLICSFDGVATSQAAMAKRDIRVGDPNAFASFAILAARLCHHPLALVYDRRETHRAV
jgi:hypothetical protein